MSNQLYFEKGILWLAHSIGLLKGASSHREAYETGKAALESIALTVSALSEENFGKFQDALEHVTNQTAMLKLDNLRPVFDIVDRNTQSWQFPYAQYPSDAMPTKQILKPLGSDIAEALLQDLKQITHYPQADFLDTSFTLLEKHTFFISHPFSSDKALSFSEVQRLCASIDAATSGTALKALIIGGDLSGIQSYLYSIQSRKAAKNLRGRSFYLQAIVDGVLSRLQKELGLPWWSVLYSSGGGFYLVAPENESIKATLNDVTAEIQEDLFSAHQAKLYLAISHVSVSLNQVRGSSLRQVWSKLMENISEQKRRPFSGFITNHFNRFFTNAGDKGGRNLRDAITGEEIAGKTFPLDKESDNSVVVSLSTHQQIETGRLLRENKFIVGSSKEYKHLEVLKDSFGYTFTNNAKEFVDQAEISVLNAPLNVSDFTQVGSYRHRLQGGKNTPVNAQGQPLMFEELVSNGAQAEGSYNKLGILRMDVDNLGMLFREGFNDSELCLSRYSTLSKELDLFFKFILNELWEESKKEPSTRRNYSRSVQIVYSGGDDMFLVGHWNTLLDFSIEVNNAFKAFVCGNRALSLSGGIVIVDEKFPVLKAAEMAEEAEKRAKSHIYQSNGKKNALDVLGYALNWDEEVPFVMALRREINGYLSEQGSKFPKSFISNVSHFAHKAEFDRHNRITNYEVIWQFAYVFKRMIPNLASEAQKEFLRKWTTYVYSGKLPELPGTKWHSLQLLIVACRLSEFDNR